MFLYKDKPTIFVASMQKSFAGQFMHRHINFSVRLSGRLPGIVTILFSFPLLQRYVINRIACTVKTMDLLISTVLTMNLLIRILLNNGFTYQDTFKQWIYLSVQFSRRVIYLSGQFSRHVIYIEVVT